eukprot:scaffold32735_cov14-Tisochrysis_lutea.AAC.1
MAAFGAANTWGTGLQSACCLTTHQLGNARAAGRPTGCPDHPGSPQQTADACAGRPADPVRRSLVRSQLVLHDVVLKTLK